MTVGDLKSFLEIVDDELFVYLLFASENPLDSGRSVNRAIFIANDTEATSEAVYLMIDL